MTLLNESIATVKVLAQVFPRHIHRLYAFVNKLCRKTWVNPSNHLQHMRDSILFELIVVSSRSNISEIYSFDDFVHKRYLILILSNGGLSELRQTVR